MMPKIACTCGHIVIANTLRLPRELRCSIASRVKSHSYRRNGLLPKGKYISSAHSQSRVSSKPNPGNYERR